MDTYSIRNGRLLYVSQLLSQQGHKSVIRANTLRGLFTLWRLQSTVVHFHGWGLATFSWLLALISPQSTFVWTIDTLPRSPRWIATWIVSMNRLVCDAITTPTRTLQYQLLNTYNLSTAYIPDGYTPPTAPVIPAAHFGLKPDHYTLVFADSATSLKVVLDAYKATKSQRKLVIFHETTPAAQRLQAKYPFLHVVAPPYARGVYSLLQQALVVIFADTEPKSDLLLQAMASGRPVISTTVPLHQELLGVTGQYYKPGDAASLTQAFKKAFKSRVQRQAWGLAAKLRASHHFTWERITNEYLQQYHSFRLPVALDSLQPQPSLAVRGK